MIYIYIYIYTWLRRCATSRTARDRFRLVSLDYSVTYSFRPYYGPGVDSATSENEYQEYFLGVKVTHMYIYSIYIYIYIYV